MCACDIWPKISVFAAAGVTQLTMMLRGASSFASDLVSAMSPAFDAL